MSHDNKTYTETSRTNFCVCRECKAKYAAEPLQSRIYCRLCRPPSMVQPVCFHSVSLHLPCEQCKAMYGSTYMRFMPKPPPQKRGPKPGAARAKAITMTRMRAVTSPMTGESPDSSHAVRRTAL
jgi:hypothetical protein